MPSPDMPPELSLFAYPTVPLTRRHGPQGYTDDENHKPWLRDEFDYRCLYCRCREVWFPDGNRHFSVEHLLPTSQALPGLTDYDSLVYACCQCNATRQANPLPLDVLGGLSTHREVNAEGSISGLTPEGEDFIRDCRLDRPLLTASRRLMMNTISLLRSKQEPAATRLMQRHLGSPSNLPKLEALRPPGGNRRPAGIHFSAWVRHHRSQLPDNP